MTIKTSIKQSLKKLSELANQKELPLQEVADNLTDLLIEIEDFMDDCERKASKTNPNVPRGKLGGKLGAA